MASPFRLDGKVAYVTGSTRGIGRAIAERLADAGATVVVNGRASADAVAAVERDLTERHDRRALGIHADQADARAASDAFRSILSTFGRLDIFVNNAGILDDALIGMISNRSIAETFETNTFACIRNLQSAAKLMRRQGSGSIINVASIVGTHGNAGEVVYGSTKAAVVGLTLSAAKELAPEGIRVNAIAPGFIDTDLTRSIPPPARQQWLERIGMGRVGEPEDVADVAVFLATDQSRYVTGQVIGVDGALVL